MVKITINDKLLEVPEGTTVLEAARKVGIAIPTLCYYEAVKPYGGCRLCLVEITQGGRTQLTTSCTYPVSEGLSVITESPDITEARRLMIDLLLSRCPGCLNCRRWRDNWESKNQVFRKARKIASSAESAFPCATNCREQRRSAWSEGERKRK